jgi:hypothetical protein
MPTSDKYFPKKAGEHGRNVSYKGFKVKLDEAKEQVNKGKGDNYAPTV